MTSEPEDAVKEADSAGSAGESWAIKVGNEIKGAGRRIPSADVCKWVDEVGGPGFTEDKSKSLRRELNKAVPGIQYDRLNSLFYWEAPVDGVADAAAPHASPELGQLLDGWLLADATGKAELEASISRAVLRGRSGHPLVHVARVLGAIAGDPDWSAVHVGDCEPSSILRAVVERAPKWWLFDAAVRAGAKDGAVVRDAFQQLPEAEQEEIVADAIVRWFADQRAENTSALVRRIRTVMKAAVTVDVVTAAVSVSLRIAHEDDSSSDLLALLGLVVAADGEVVRSAFDALPADAPITGYLKVLAATKRSQRERMNLLAAVAQSEKSRAVFDAGVFSSLTLDQLGEVLSADPFPQLRDEGLDDHLATAVRAATPSKLGAALAPVAQHPHLESLVSVDLLAKLARRDEASARLGRASMTDVVGAAMEAGEEAHAGEIYALKDELEERDRQLVLARADAQALTDKVASLDARLREALAATSSASLGELRQARLDVIQVIIDLAVRIGDAASVAESADPIHDISATIERDLSGLDVTVVGRRGEVVPFNPAFFEASDVADGSPVEVVRPAFVLEGGVTHLRYGLIRPVPDV